MPFSQEHRRHRRKGATVTGAETPQSGVASHRATGRPPCAETQVVEPPKRATLPVDDKGTAEGHGKAGRPVARHPKASRRPVSVGRPRGPVAMPQGTRTGEIRESCEQRR
jgi:hypothetical protein